MAIAISLACENSDRTRALIDGRVGIEGCDVTFVPAELEDIFRRSFRYGDFDIAELSFSTHLVTVSRGEHRYLGIPAFVSRSFRHGAIYIRTDRGIRAPADLAGRLVGVPDFQQTAGVWIRGMLADDYGVKTSDIRWRTGGLEQPGRSARMPLQLPPQIAIEPVGADLTLSEMLAVGKLDAIISPQPPSCFERGSPDVGRLFPDWRAAEEDYFARTGLFPLMHIIGVRRSLVERHPWLPASVYKAFAQAKAIAMQELSMINFLRVSSPWMADDLRRAKKLMGEDFWRYGVQENEREIAAILRYALNDGLIARTPSMDEIFAPSTHQATLT